MTPSEKQEILSELSVILDRFITTPLPSPSTSADCKPVEMLTINECTELVKGLSRHTIRELVGRGELHAIRAGAGKNGKILISKASLLDYVNSVRNPTKG